MVLKKKLHLLRQVRKSETSKTVRRTHTHINPTKSDIQTRINRYKTDGAVVWIAKL